MKKDSESKNKGRRVGKKASSSDKPEACQSKEGSASETGEDADSSQEKKIGEGPGNLRQREHWFRQRTGGSRK